MSVQDGPSSGVADTALLRRAFGSFATGVIVVTVGGGDPHGMTANSFTSVSLDPPLLLLCVARDAIMHGCLQRAAGFGVSVLAADQADVARHFADRRRPLGRAQFDPVDWLAGPLTGAPLMIDALAHFECELWRTYDGGDHTIYLGRLLSVDRGPADDALLFLHGTFRQLVHQPSEVKP
jgi:flavin reductase (DIM6/NTAB) family NADH-FMN oxidoreductase RutF